MQCRQCGAEISDSASYCRSCGEHVSVFHTEAIKSARPVAPLDIDDDDYKTKVVIESSPRPVSKKEKNIWPAVAVGMGSAFLCTLAILLYSIYRPSNNDNQQAIGINRDAVGLSGDAAKPVSPISTPQIVATPVRNDKQTPLPVEYDPKPSYNPSADDYPIGTVQREVDPKYQVWVYRIHFPKGYSRAVIRDNIPKLNRYYVFFAQANQTLSVSFRSPSPSAFYWVKYHDTQGEISPNTSGDWSGVLPRTGDYEINVDCGDKPNGAPTHIEMVVTLK